MIHKIIFIFPLLLDLINLTNDFINDDCDDANKIDDIIPILNFLNLINPLLDIFYYIFDLTQKNCRDNDAYKLIRYCAHYR